MRDLTSSYKSSRAQAARCGWSAWTEGSGRAYWCRCLESGPIHAETGDSCAHAGLAQVAALVPDGSLVLVRQPVQAG